MKRGRMAVDLVQFLLSLSTEHSVSGVIEKGQRKYAVSN